MQTHNDIEMISKIKLVWSGLSLWLEEEEHFDNINTSNTGVISHGWSVVSISLFSSDFVLIHVIKLNQLKAMPFFLSSKSKCPRVLMDIFHLY